MDFFFIWLIWIGYLKDIWPEFWLNEHKFTRLMICMASNIWHENHKSTEGQVHDKANLGMRFQKCLERLSCLSANQNYKALGYIRALKWSIEYPKMFHLFIPIMPKIFFDKEPISGLKTLFFILNRRIWTKFDMLPHHLEY